MSTIARKCSSSVVDRFESIRMNESERALARAYMQAGESLADGIFRVSMRLQTFAALMDRNATLLARRARSMFDRPVQRPE